MKDAERILRNHLAHLQVLRDRLEPGHIAVDAIEGRIKEAQEAIKAVRAHSA